MWELPVNPYRVYKRALALLIAIRDGYGGPTIPIIFKYLVSKAFRRIKHADTMVNDIRYGPFPRQKLDMQVFPLLLFVMGILLIRMAIPQTSPPKTTRKLCPVIVICPGYQWSSSSK